MNTALFWMIFGVIALFAALICYVVFFEPTKEDLMTFGIAFIFSFIFSSLGNRR